MHTVSLYTSPSPACDRGLLVEQAFDRYYTALVFFANRLLNDRNNARDIVSDVFLTLWERREGFASEPSIKAYLYISTRNACFNALKAAQHLPVKQAQYVRQTDQTEGNVLDTITRAEVLRELHVLIRQLPPQCRAIMTMACGGLDQAEIARRRGRMLIQAKLRTRRDLLSLALVAVLETLNS